MTPRKAAAPVTSRSPRSVDDRQADLADTLERLREGVQTLSTTDGWKAWLQFAACMPNYSVNNQLLILAQHPTASAVASYTTWKSLGRQVVRGEKGIRILAPTKRVVATVDHDDDTNRSTALSGSSPGTPDGGAVRRVVTGYRTVSVFDVSQTSGAPIPDPQRPTLLTGVAPPHVWPGLADQVQQAGFRLERVPTAAAIGGAIGVTDFGTRTVQVRADVSGAQAAKTLAHELAHVLLHDPAHGSGSTAECRDDKEGEAESVAFIVLAHAGLDTSDYSFGYVAGWAAGAQPDAIRAHAQRILEASRSIISSLAPSPSDATTPAVVPPLELALSSPLPERARATVGMTLP